MSNYKSIKSKLAEQQQTNDVDVTRCEAYGCPCRATISVEGGRWTCVNHAFMVQDDWQNVTRKLNENKWLVDFIGDMQRMAAKHEDWRGFASMFWAGTDEHCMPDPKEADVPYQNRMRGELMWRAGAIAKRPAVRLPKPVKPSGSFANKEVPA